jgi:nucleoside permease NupC
VEPWKHAASTLLVFFAAVALRFFVQWLKGRHRGWAGLSLFSKGLLLTLLGAVGGLLEAWLLGVPWEQAVRDGLAVSTTAVALHEMNERRKGRRQKPSENK